MGVAKKIIEAVTGKKTTKPAPTAFTNRRAVQEFNKAQHKKAEEARKKQS